jgi:predicted nucleic acid-binding protein
VLRDFARRFRSAQLRRQLDAGEAECLAVALARDLTLLSDDFAALRMARQRGAKVSGTLGVLLLLAQEGHLTPADADDLLRTFVARGYRSPVQSLRERVGHDTFDAAWKEGQELELDQAMQLALTP